MLKSHYQIHCITLYKIQSNHLIQFLIINFIKLQYLPKKNHLASFELNQQIMFQIFSSKALTRISSASTIPINSFVGVNYTQQLNKLENLNINDMEQENKRSESFFKEVENWRNLQLNYINKLSEIQNNLKQKMQVKSATQQLQAEIIHSELIKLFESIIFHHKNMLSKLNYDIIMVNCQTSQRLYQDTKNLINQQKGFQKDIASKKQQLQKVLLRKDKLKRMKEEELTVQIFMHDSIECTMEQKIRRFNKFKQIEKQKEEYELKVQESVQNYKKSCDNMRLNHLKYFEKLKQQNRCKYETIMKMQLHLLTCLRNLTHDVEEISNEISKNQSAIIQGQQKQNEMERRQAKNTIILQDIVKKQNQNKQKLLQKAKKQEDILKKMSQKKIGYLQYSLKLIIDKEIDDLIDYSKDKEIKGKVKKMMQSNEVNPEQTDQMCRQIQLIKKIIKNPQDKVLMQSFRIIISKNSKLRMNFIFIMQFFRLNSKFEIAQQLFKPMFLLINQFLQVCHQNRDCFVLKQLMVLLMTYYVILDKSFKSSRQIPLAQQQSKMQPKSQVIDISQNGLKEKIYIIHFFKKNSLWKDLQFWESLLIQCVYSQKKNTIKMLMVGLQTSAQKKEMIEAEKSAIVNQILYVVKNMIIFEFTQKDVKIFTSRFVKLLKQDDKCLKDVYKTIQQAAKEQKQQQQQKSIQQYIQKFLTPDTLIFSQSLSV